MEGQALILLSRAPSARSYVLLSCTGLAAPPTSLWSSATFYHSLEWLQSGRTVSLVAKYRPPMPIMVRCARCGWMLRKALWQPLALPRHSGRAACGCSLLPACSPAPKSTAIVALRTPRHLPLPLLQAVVVPTLKSTRLGWKLEGGWAG